MSRRVQYYEVYLATIASIIAGLVIELLLAMIYSEGVAYLFSDEGIVYALVLFFVGIIAYWGYSHGTIHARKAMAHLSPLALVLAGAGVFSGYAGLLNYVDAAYLVIAGYFVELLVAPFLAKDLSSYSPGGSRVFALGVLVFVLSLPLIVYDKRFALVSLAGNTVKIAGLASVLQNIRRVINGSR